MICGKEQHEVNDSEITFSCATITFIIYCLLNIYGGILVSALPMVVHCQHACKRFALSVKLYCSTVYKNLFNNQY